MNCDCCRVSAHYRSPTQVVIEMDGWWYPSWGEFARVLDIPRDVVRKRVERGQCLRLPVVRRGSSLDVGRLASRFCGVAA